MGQIKKLHTELTPTTLCQNVKKCLEMLGKSNFTSEHTRKKISAYSSAHLRKPGYLNLKICIQQAHLSSKWSMIRITQTVNRNSELGYCVEIRIIYTIIPWSNKSVYKGNGAWGNNGYFLLACRNFVKYF